MKKITLCLALIQVLCSNSLFAQSESLTNKLHSDPLPTYAKKPQWAVATNQETANPASNTYDNDSGTRWAGLATTTEPVYITFDLACDNYTLESMSIKFYNNNSTIRTYNYKIATSLDGVNFTDVAPASYSETATNPASWENITLGGVAARYVRLYGYNNSHDGGVTVNNYFFSIYEVVFSTYQSTDCLLLANSTFKASNFKLYPNPATADEINLEYNTTIGAVEVFDITGKSLITTTIESTSGQVDVSTLSSGTYFVKVLGTTQKLIR